MEDIKSVRGCLASLHMLEAGLSELQIQTASEEAHDVYRESMLKIRTTAARLETRINELETTPPQ
ncbi:hypothetical protein [Alteribacter natronophilus]|uniref:hypothetical protein n=1 Tax=Alteribacter natronophilus TaxID=2583810 RepID=UPI00110ECF0E|nr:hypothetical protein [Alteribacter natronophilus]TMW73655.1 hypothetical protein FGB90_04985 [Alteribacter natronophilus]